MTSEKGTQKVQQKPSWQSAPKRHYKKYNETDMTSEKTQTAVISNVRLQLYEGESVAQIPVKLKLTAANIAEYPTRDK